MLNATSYARDFRTFEDQIAFLGYLRRDVPELYQEFILRSEAIPFLEAAQNAIEQIGYDSEKIIHGKVMKVFAPSQRSGFANDSVDDSQARSVIEDLRGFLKEYRAKPNYLDPPAAPMNLFDAITTELRHIALLDGVLAGLMQSESIPGLREILHLPDHHKLLALEGILSSMDSVQGVEPQRLGIVRNFLTGPEVLDVFHLGLNAPRNVVKLILLGALVSDRIETDIVGRLSTQQLSDLSSGIAKLSTTDFAERLGAEQFRRYAEGITNAASSVLPIMNKAKIRKIVQKSYAGVRAADFLPTVELALEMERAHPFAAYLRGEVGDCSTDASPSVSIASHEEIYWIRIAGERKVRGYLQFTHVKVGGEDALYVNTISGPELNREDVKRIFFALFQSQQNLGAKHIVIPDPKIFKDIINYPEVALVLEQLAQDGQVVPIEYLDGKERSELAAFSQNSLDLPEFNRIGVLIRQDSLRVNGLLVDTKDVALNSEAMFQPLSSSEALILALDLRNREADHKNIAHILKQHGITAEAFELFWRKLANEQKANVEVFHEQIQSLIVHHALPVEWGVFKHSALMYQGHFAAADAVQGANLGLAMQYASAYLSSFSNLNYVYKSLKPHFAALSSRPEFLKLVRNLFKKNRKEMARLLDSFELENRSAYRTLINLFDAGLPQEAFTAELKELDQPLEDKAEFHQRKDSVFIRRKTLLASLDRGNVRHFDEIMSQLEKMSLRKKVLDADDLRTVSHYFSSFMRQPNASQAQIQRIQNFLVGSEFGMSFTQSLGEFDSQRLDVPAIVEVLFSAGKYLWAAYLIHRDPWPQHPLAPQWLGVLWSHRNQVGDSIFLEGLRANPNILSMPGIGLVINELMQTARQDAGNESTLVRALLQRPENWDELRLTWLSQVSTQSLATLVIEALDEYIQSKRFGVQASWLQKQLLTRFSSLARSGECPVLLGGI